MRKLILRSFQSPGDILMLTAAVRDLHAAYPGQFLTDVRTSADAIWENNPHITALKENEPGVRTLDMHYPLIHHSNQRPYHFIHGYAQYLEQQLGLTIPITKFHGDVYLTDEEKETPGISGDLALPKAFGSSSRAASMTSLRSGGTRRATRTSSITFVAAFSSCNVVKPITGTHGLTGPSIWSARQL